MKKYSSLDEYFDDLDEGKELLLAIRAIINETELSETLKWSAPCYTLNNKNVLGLASFKHHVALWFHNGCFLKDDKKKLVNAQEGKTKALRQWRFEINESFDPIVLKDYILEAIENEKLGKKMKPSKTKKLERPTLIIEACLQNENLNAAFETLSLSKQNEYIEHINSAKRETTKVSRLNKIIPLILEGKGLHDKYKSC